jgi:murein L,D-transpeptidase YcbB/YkuD
MKRAMWIVGWGFVLNLFLPGFGDLSDSVNAKVSPEHPIYQFDWHTATGRLNAKGQALVDVLTNSDEHGLDSLDYVGASNPIQMSDEALTKAAMAYIRDLKVGRKTPRQIDPALHVSPPEINAQDLLSDIHESRDIDVAMERLAPQYPEYQLLKKRLSEYRKIAEQGGWSKLPDGKTLEQGVEDGDVILLRNRLITQSYLNPSTAISPNFDDELAESIRSFQGHHGLEVDGKVGRRTRNALNVSVEDRIIQIVLNMERWRWLPDDLGRRHVRVNIAGFYLRVFEENQPVMEMPVIVGKPYRRTPMFSSVITDVTFHPFWHVPSKIAYANVIPEIIKSSGYLKRQDFEVLRPEPEGRLKVIEQPETLPWSDFLNSRFPYKLRQKPGDKNALGHVRFNIRNDFDIYMHGTPDQGLFSQPVRAKSSGCIRVAEPLKLTEYLLRDYPSWPVSRIREVYSQFESIANPKPLNVTLIEPFPVHILYWTAWVGDDDHLYFRDDIYGRDKILGRALFPKGVSFLTRHTQRPIVLVGDKT